MAALLSETVTPTVPEAEVPVVGRARGPRTWLWSLDIYVPGVFLLALLFVCFIRPYLYKLPSPVGGNILTGGLPVGSPGHILGTTTVGNDLMSRLIYGGQSTFEVVFAVQAIGLLVGGGIGVTVAMLRGIAESVVMRVLDVIIAFPAFVLVVVVILGLGASEVTMIWALALISIPTFARVARAGAVTVREQTYVVAAQLAGTKRWKIALRHIVPNIFTSLLTFAVLGSGIVVILEATISYFGYGIPPPAPTWGNMIATGQQTMTSRPSQLLIPCLVLLVVVIALNTLSEGMRRRWGSVR